MIFFSSCVFIQPTKLHFIFLKKFVFIFLITNVFLTHHEKGKCREEDGTTVIPDSPEIATVTILASSLSVPFL